MRFSWKKWKADSFDKIVSNFAQTVWLYLGNKYFISCLYKTNTCFSRHTCDDKTLAWCCDEPNFVTEIWGLCMSLASWVYIDLDIGVRIKQDSTVLQGAFLSQYIPMAGSILWNVWYGGKHENWNLSKHEKYLCYSSYHKKWWSCFLFLIASCRQQ